MSDTDSPDESDAKTDRLGWLAWGVLVAVGVAAYELFHQPALLGATISLKFAWGDARTGYWLRARDPDRRRGRANFWVYLGYGLWKAAICGVVLSLVFVGLDAALHGKAANRPPGQQNQMLIIIFGGSCGGSFFTAVVSAAICCVGFVGAWRAGTKLWLNSRVAACRVRDLWPPEGGDTNRLASIALPTAIVASSLVAGATAVAVAFAVDPKQNARWAGALVITFCTVVVVMSFALIRSVWLKEHLTALSPNEAWPDGESGA